MNPVSWGRPTVQEIAEHRNRQMALPSIRDEAERRSAGLALQKQRHEWVQAFAQQTLRRSVAAETAETESLVWFWFNHFNVYAEKSVVGALLADYVETAIRPHVHGSFRDMVLATLTHPAMLVYLDNARNAAGQINENQARELLELHTLGVQAGYSQADVQEVARVLTGVGLRPLRTKALPRDLQAQARAQGELYFDPARHDFGDKQVLGRRIRGEGFRELEVLADLLAAHPATARRVAHKLCVYLVGDEPPAGLVEQAATAFTASGGDLRRTVAAVQRGARELQQQPPSFKTPYRYVLDAVQLLAGGQPVENTLPLVRWLAALGQPLFRCSTPDGYSLLGRDWLSAGQLTQRFELARTMVDALPRLMGEPPAAAPAPGRNPAVQALEERLGARSRQVLAQATGPAERLALLLSCPEFMYR